MVLLLRISRALCEADCALCEERNPMLPGLRSRSSLSARRDWCAAPFACAASAYMSCFAIYNDYDGVQHDYTRKQGLVWEHVFLPDCAPAEW